MSVMVRPSAKLIMKKQNKSGFSLIEVMVSILILLVLIIGGAAVLYQTGGTIQVEGNKRAVLERVRTEFERQRNLDYMVLRARAVNGNPEVINYNEVYNGMSISVSFTNELIATGGILNTMSSGVLDNEYIKLSVLATYGTGSDDTVFLHSYKSLQP